MDVSFISSLSDEELRFLRDKIAVESNARYDRRKEKAWTKATQALQEYIQEFGGIEIVTYNESFYISDLTIPETGYIDAR